MINVIIWIQHGITETVVHVKGSKISKKEIAQVASSFGAHFGPTIANEIAESTRLGEIRRR